MDTEQNMKQTSELSRELCCQEAKNIIFCKILCIFLNSAQFTRFCEKFRVPSIAESFRDCHFALYKLLQLNLSPNCVDKNSMKTC